MIIENKGIIYKVLINKILYIEVRKKDLTIYTEDERIGAVVFLIAPYLERY